MSRTLALHNGDTVFGPKQDTGSIRNNQPHIETTEIVPQARFLTETTDRYRRIKNSEMKLDCSFVPRSGFTLSNKFEYGQKAISEESLVSDKLNFRVNSCTLRLLTIGHLN
jgi:hypothetical protein